MFVLRMILTICVGMTFLFGSAAYAQDYARSGFYVGAGWSYVREDFDDGFEDDTWGINGRFGYRFYPKVAAELEFEWYDDFLGEEKAWSLMVNMKGYLLTGQFQPYGMVGVGLLDVDGTEFAWQVGGGLDLYTYATASGDQYLVNVEAAYVIPTSDLDDWNFWTLSIGVQYRF